MNVLATFDYEIVKKSVKLHYMNSEVDFEKLDKMSDDENCPTYLNLFSKMLKKYGIKNLRGDKYEI